MEQNKINQLVNRLTKTGVWFYNLDQDTLNWDEQMFEIYEIDPKDFSGDFSSLESLVHEEDLDMVKESYRQAVEEKGEYNVVFRIHSFKGNLKYIKANGVLVRSSKTGDRLFTGANQDITEIIKEREEKEELSQILRDSQETAIIGSWQHNVKTGQTYNDVITKRICGLEPDYDLQAAEGISFYKEGWSRDTITKRFGELIETGRSYDLELPMITKQGKEIWVRAIGKPVYNSKKEIVKVTGVFQDITAQKEKEQRLIESNEHLKKLGERLSEQNRKLHDFAHITSHNLRAPVANLMMLKELLLIEKDPSELAQLHSLIGETTERLNETLDHLLDALVVQSEVSVERQKINLENQVEDLKSRLNYVIKEAGVKIETDLKLRHLYFNPLYLESILLNLVSNALKFRRNEVESTLVIKSYLYGEYPVMEITDNGIGIDLEQHRDRIFGLSNTFHHHGSAKGVGLFMCKNHMEAMGGTIRVESEVNVGTTFILQFSPSSFISE